MAESSAKTESKPTAADAESQYKATLMKKEKFRQDNKYREEAHTNRQLIHQLEHNIRQFSWHPQMGYIHMQNLIKENAELVDSENRLNNYADYCIHPEAKYKNQSSSWKSSITADHPMFQKLYEKHKNVTIKNDVVLTSILQSKPGKRIQPTPSFSNIGSSSSFTSFNNVKSSFSNSTTTGGSKSAISGAAGTSKNGGTTVRPTQRRETKSSMRSDNQRQENGGNVNSDFNMDDVIIEDDDFMDDKSPPKPVFNKNQGVKPIFGNPATKRTNSSGTNQQGATGSFLDKIRFSVHPGSSAAASKKTQNNSGTSAWNNPGNRNNQNRNTGVQMNTTNQNTNSGSKPTNSFKTAHEQLFIDQQNKKQRGGGGASSSNSSITQASYGGNRKTLGTRPGPAAGFKPPVKQDEEQSKEQQKLPAAGGSEGNPENPELQDPRYKNIDTKMIELIINEIMDSGAPVHWNDIAGLHFQKKTVKEIVVLPLLRPDIFTGLRGPPKGLLLFGPPGTGKTLIGKCIASQSKSTFFSISASSLTSKWVGEGEKMVRALFAVARVHQPSVVFIDEIDSLLSARSETEHESSRRMKTEFLVQLDGAGTDGEEKILIVGATNRPQELDEAARRRLVKRLLIPLPEGEARRQIIVNLLAKERNDISESDIDEIVKMTEGYSGADMANLCREAAMGPIRSIDLSLIESMEVEEVRPIMKQDLEDALRQVKASVSDQDLQMYEDWNEKYGAGK